MTSGTAAAPALLWLRRELRLRDNAALAAAIASGRPVLPVYVLDEATPGAWARIDSGSNSVTVRCRCSGMPSERRRPATALRAHGSVGRPACSSAAPVSRTRRGNCSAMRPRRSTRFAPSVARSLASFARL